MRIDIHVHTKKTKSGDSENRNIEPVKFAEIIKGANVKILAVTNHNHFDVDQFTKLEQSVDGSCKLWPGIELDILEDSGRAHLIVIVNPKNATLFGQRVNDVLNGHTADSFTISIENTVKAFDDLDPIYIAHYHTKKPALSDKDVQALTDLVSNNKRILKEASNSISTGIYINHGHNSIYGSDVQNWDEYLKQAKDLPELRLPVESYEQFCLLLEKDIATINTMLDKKTKESVQLVPFSLGELLDLEIYNDINVLFGSKGTGKTEILKALSKYYNEKGFKTEVYESSTMRLDEVYDIRGTKFNTTAENYEIAECTEEIALIKEATEKGITSLTAYQRYFSAVVSNRLAKRLKINGYIPQDENSPNRSFKSVKKHFDTVNEFYNLIKAEQSLTEVIGVNLQQEFLAVIEKVLSKLKQESDVRYIDYKSIYLFNHLVKVFTSEIAKKTGQPEKPKTTGFHEYACNRIAIEGNVKKIVTNINKKIQPEMAYVGNLGNKGELNCQTNVEIQNGHFTNVTFNPVNGVQKTAQKKVALQIEKISKYIYSNTLFEEIAALNEIDNSENITCVSDLLQFNRHFTLNGKNYNPSNGESSMVLLHKELVQDKPIFIIDEPEKSLGNDYISEVIVPLLKEHAKVGKRIIIATHDANIAVRTLPYNSIYREHDIDGYFTYKGNPFSNNLCCLTKDRDDLDWKEISMKTLEGGRKAFGERRKIYGNT